MGVWSIAGICTGLGTGLTSLIGWRSLLGVAEAGGIPATGKAIRLHLRPEERAIGTGMNQAALSLGLIIAPPLTVWIASLSNWRTSFIVTGLLGLLWIPLWRMVAPPEPNVRESGGFSMPKIARDSRLWRFASASALSLFLLTLWSNWTILMLTDIAGTTLERAAWLAAIPPLFATAGGLTGGWLSFRLIKAGREPFAARRLACLIASIGAISAAGAASVDSDFLMTALISASWFFVAAFSVNMYAIPLDVFDSANAAFAISALTFAYGIMQAIVSPMIGRAAETVGYAPVCIIAAFTPLAAWLILQTTASRAS